MKLFEYGREAMMFMGDHWIGMEPFMDEFASIGLDAVVGSVGNGATLRLFSDIKNVKYTEKQNIGTATPSSPTKEFEGLKWGVVGDSLSDSSINADTKYHKIIKEKNWNNNTRISKRWNGIYSRIFN